MLCLAPGARLYAVNWHLAHLWRGMTGSDRMRGNDVLTGEAGTSTELMARALRKPDRKLIGGNYDTYHNHS